MKFNYQGNSKSPGIYKIINSHTNRIYVGQAKSFQQRWHGHSNSLKSNKHQNKFLQNDFNKCKEELGHDDFLEFHVIEVMVDSSKEQRNKREEELIAEHYDKRVSCYNFREKVTGTDRTCYSKTPEETSRFLSEKSKALWQDPNWAAQQGQAIKAALSDPEVQERKRQGHRRSWAGDSKRKSATSERMKERMLDPVSKEKAVAALRENQPKGRVTYQNRMKTDQELRARMREVGRKNIAKRNATQPVKTYGSVVSPDGTVYPSVSHVPTFAKEHGLCKTNLYSLLNGKSKSHKGWKLFNPVAITT